MPPRHAYWTILVDERPTAFRSAAQEDLQPTFKRLKEKHRSARMVWFQNGKVWATRLEAQEAMRARGEMGRRGDVRQGGGFRDRARTVRVDQPIERRDAAGKLEWQPKSAARTTAHRREAGFGRPDGKRRTDSNRVQLEWRPKGSATATKTTEPKKPRPRHEARATGKPGERRDKSWRPGGEHRDPRQKYKDAKKAKWTRFKQTVRKRWEAKHSRKKKDDE